MSTTMYRRRRGEETPSGRGHIERGRWVTCRSRNRLFHIACWKRPWRHSAELTLCTYHDIHTYACTTYMRYLAISSTLLICPESNMVTLHVLRADTIEETCRRESREGKCLSHPISLSMNHDSITHGRPSKLRSQILSLSLFRY